MVMKTKKVVKSCGKMKLGSGGDPYRSSLNLVWHIKEEFLVANFNFSIIFEFWVYAVPPTKK